MYTGAQPDVHGIKFYTKPVLKIETLFDVLIRAGKKVAIVSQDECSVSKIFLERDMDYYIYPTIEEVNAKAFELIVKDIYDVLIIYNTNYDYVMHRNGVEHYRALAELRTNASVFSTIVNAVKNLWADKHDTLIGFAMDHGCHQIDGDAGSHGLEMEEDINIKHSYLVLPKK
jgi:predicted AlkP superfamily pyrophosphatase or phosphodiesterase